MSSIAGFFQPNTIYSKENEFCIKTIHDMSQALIHRGPDEQSFYYFPQGAFHQNFLLAGYIPDTFPHQLQPVTVTYQGNTYTLLMDGFISNPEELAIQLEIRQISTKGMSIEMVLLYSFISMGVDFIQHVRGAFAMAIYNETEKELHLLRDPLGLRPLFYTQKAGALVFASEIKALFQYPGVRATLDRDGLTELFALGPARRPGSAIFKDIAEVKPGHCLTYRRSSLRDRVFHQFKIREHQDSYEDTLENIRYLLNKSISHLTSGVMPMSSLLSGGLDSSIVTAKLAEKGTTPLASYSLEFDNSKQHFKPSAFQPALDTPYVEEMANHLGTKHTNYICNNQIQFQYLKKSVLAHDLPCMADVDSSYLYLCEKVGKQHKIVFTGECADEIFCGYPWYHNSTGPINDFPWSNDLSARLHLLKDDLISTLPLQDCVHTAYSSTCREIGLDGDQTPAHLEHHKVFYLTIRYFMQTLINRGDRAAAFNSLDARVPFAHQELTEYLFQVPMEMQAKNGERKHLLRAYATGLLPENIRSRKKSPYPKTYDPGYESLVNQELLKALAKPDCPLHLFIDKTKAESFCRQSKDLGRPWYGQLMAGPQLTAYYLQILYWIEQYHIQIEL